MICNEYAMLAIFLKFKPHVFLGFENGVTDFFILYLYERFHKLEIVHQDEVDFVTCQLHCEASQ